mgnify:CR=1 FL=1
MPRPGLRSACVPGLLSFRRKSSGKWYGVLLTVGKDKLIPGSCGNVERIALRIDPSSPAAKEKKYLQMSMFDRQKTLMKLHNVDVNDLVAGVMSTFKLKVEKYGGVIDADLEAEDAIVSVDEMHFTNVIFNLLDNAVKYRREEEPLSLFIRTRTVGDKVEISIRDNGIGIKREDLKKIFDKFYRVSTGNRHDVKGFGLGLAYVHKIITDLKGDIRVESEINQGSTFIITLPLIKNK